MNFVRDEELVSDNSGSQKENGQKWKIIGLVFLVAAALYCILAQLDGQVWMSTSGHSFRWWIVPLFHARKRFEKDYKASLMCLIIAFIIANAILDLLQFQWFGKWFNCPVC